MLMLVQKPSSEVYPPPPDAGPDDTRPESRCAQCGKLTRSMVAGKHGGYALCGSCDIDRWHPRVKRPGRRTSMQTLGGMPGGWPGNPLHEPGADIDRAGQRILQE